ncbi:transcriptional regulator [Mitsuaria sp. CC2]|uniref:helix-turn-helix domain-containing protein n=1 Tax=Mitsuaria sp. CC2 TaxID=3029186 RepID=UPI003B8ADB9B
MKRSIRSPEELGSVIRAVRKHSKVRQDDLAGMANVSKQFAVDAERGKATMQFGKLLQLLDELGITLTINLPDAVEPILQKLETQRTSEKKKSP